MINSAQIIANAQDAFGFLKNCDDKTHKAFLSEAIHIQLNKGSHIIEQGSHCTHLALMLKGTVRVYVLEDTGREITLYRIDGGQSCVLTASCIQSNTPFPAFAACETNAEAILIPSHSLQKWLSESDAWRHYIFGLISQRMASVISLVEEVTFHKLDQRIAKLLILYENKNSSSAAIHVTHHEIALELGTSREVVSRILLRFQASKLIHLTRGSIVILNFEGIRNQAREAKNIIAA